MPGCRALAAAALAAAAGLLAGCGETTLASTLRNAGVGGAPDEFLVLPTEPLEIPADLRALPPPTPGAVNRVDRRPEVDAVAALTGRPVSPGAATAGALVARAGPVDPEIRARLASEDAVYRQENRGRLLERFNNRNPDWMIYEDMRLNADAEFRRLRSRGVRVPAAPPPGQ
jgi:hypothetical protein